MGWRKVLTFSIFYIVLTTSFGLMITYILLIKDILPRLHRQRFLFALVPMYCTGYGCLWFRVVLTRHPYAIAVHALFNTAVLILILSMLYTWLGYYLRNGFCIPYYYWYGRTMFPIILYAFQLLLAFHLMVFRSGITAGDKAFRTELHAFLGVLVHIYFTLDATLSVFHMIFRVKYDDEHPAFGMLFVFGHAMCVWVLLLLPCFEWRTLRKLWDSKPSKTNRRPRSSPFDHSTSITYVPPHRSATARQYP